MPRRSRDSDGIEYILLYRAIHGIYLTEYIILPYIPLRKDFISLDLIIEFNYEANEIKKIYCIIEVKCRIRKLREINVINLINSKENSDGLL